MKGHVPTLLSRSHSQLNLWFHLTQSLVSPSVQASPSKLSGVPHLRFGKQVESNKVTPSSWKIQLRLCKVKHFHRWNPICCCSLRTVCSTHGISSHLPQVFHYYARRHETLTHIKVSPFCFIITPTNNNHMPTDFCRRARLISLT